jgi:hypothetical protein
LIGRFAEGAAAKQAETLVEAAAVGVEHGVGAEMPLAYLGRDPKLLARLGADTARAVVLARRWRPASNRTTRWV